MHMPAEEQNHHAEDKNGYSKVHLNSTPLAVVLKHIFSLNSRLTTWIVYTFTSGLITR